MTDKKPFYITTSIAYVNAAPHIGFAMESIEADAIARWMRKKERETFFLTGTDEHGVKIQKTANELGRDVKELCDENSNKFRNLRAILNLSNDDFIRTSDKENHWPGVRKIWHLMKTKGDIEKRKYEALYCYGCEAFFTEKDLDENGECPNHKRKPEVIAEENYFFNLSRYSDEIAELIETGKLRIIPDFRKTEILNLAKEGLHDVSFSRPAEKLPWGIPVPGDPSQTMYVWCDALTNYISGIGYGQTDDPLFQDFWEGGEVMHVIGKDILRFHAGVWIGMLLSAGIKIPDMIFVHGFLTSDGQKMSKSLGNVVDPIDEVETYGVDAVRYFLLREVPVGRDADYSKKRFEEMYQAHLANGLGNLSSRIHTLCLRNNVAPGYVLDEEKDGEFLRLIKDAAARLDSAMKEFVLHEALSAIFSLVEILDQKMTELKPWEMVKKEPEKGAHLLRNFLAAISWIADHLEPFLPGTAERMKKMFGVGTKSLGEPAMLFPRTEMLFGDK